MAAPLIGVSAQFTDVDIHDAKMPSNLVTNTYLKAVVKAGGTPWCVKTCPSRALMYGERDEILAEARARVEGIKARYPKARVYGETEAGGLGVIMVLPDDPEVLDLPGNPSVPPTMALWQKIVQPASMGITGLSIAVTGIAAVIARRNHMQEVKQFHAQHVAAEEAAAQATGVADEAVDKAKEV